MDQISCISQRRKEMTRSNIEEEEEEEEEIACYLKEES